jgi:hypothetical protein
LFLRPTPPQETPNEFFVKPPSTLIISFRFSGYYLRCSGIAIPPLPVQEEKKAQKNFSI